LKISFSNIFGILGEHSSFADSNEEEQDGMDWTSYDIDVQNIFKISKKDILVSGINWRKAESSSDGVYFRDKNEKSQRFIAGFLNNELSITDNLKWILGGRYDKFDTPDKDKFSPQSILFYKPKDNHTFRFIYSQAIRAPFIADLFTNAQFSAGDYIIPQADSAPIIMLSPNENLNPVGIKSFEIAYSTVLKNKINLDFSVYHYEVEDMIGYINAVSGDSLIFGPGIIGGTAFPTSKSNAAATDLKAVNLDGKLKSDGFEMGLNYNINKNTRLWSNYSYQNSKFQDIHTKSVPAHLASFGGHKSYKNGWTLSGSINYVSSSRIEITNVMDQTLAQINKDLAADPIAFITQAQTGADIYKQKYLNDGAYLYNTLGGADLGAAANPTLAAILDSALGGGGTLIAPLTAALNATGVSSDKVSFILASSSVTAAAAGLSASNGAALLSARGVNGELYKYSAAQVSVQETEDYCFINLKAAKKIFNDNGEFALSASLRPDKRQYAFGEKTGDKYFVTFNYKFK